MNKTELIAAIAEKTELTKKDSEKALKAFTEVVAEQLKKGETEELMKLRGEVISLWCGTKKELPSKLVSLITEGMNKGWVNITQEQIDNSKWNR